MVKFVASFGVKKWWDEEGKCHCDKVLNPVIGPDDTEIWYDEDGWHHRDDGGPAVIDQEGNKFWARHGLFHREDGPVVEWTSGDEDWYINGEKLPSFVTNIKELKSYIKSELPTTKVVGFILLRPNLL